jgi:hypothetical protein
MSGKRYTAYAGAIAVAAALLATFAVAGCSKTSTTTNGGTTAVSAIATSSAVAKAKTEVSTCVQKTGTTALLSSSGRTEFVNCLQNVVPPAQRDAFKTCITTALKSDKIWTSEGRTKFTNESLPNCVNAA